jgi:adenylyltransferase/sulfurtransferase
VLGVLPGVIGSIQALETVKLITGIGEPLVGRLLLYDALRMRVREIALPRDPDCPVCGDRPTVRELAVPPGACLPVREPQGAIITPGDLRVWRAAGPRHLLVDVREPDEHASRAIEESILVPIGHLEEQLDRIARDRPVIVYCRTGARSGRAAAILRRHGIDARSLEGGVEAWESTVVIRES